MTNTNNNYTAKLDKNQMLQAFNFYEPFFVQTKTQYEQFRAKMDGITIIGYTSGKLLFQGKNAQSEAEVFLSASNINYEMQQTPTPNNPTMAGEFDNFQTVVGSDEVGTGDFFGGIVVCAVRLTPSLLQQVTPLGLTDSKKISDKKIKEIAPKLMNILKGNYQIASIKPVTYNNKYNQQSFNMNHIKTLLHHHAISNLIKIQQEFDIVVIDEFANWRLFQKYLNHMNLPSLPKLKLMQKAESQVTAVAAASIIGRYQFLEIMAKLRLEVGYDLPLGAGKNVNEMARDIFDNKGSEFFYNCAKLNFSNYTKLL